MSIKKTDCSVGFFDFFFFFSTFTAELCNLKGEEPMKNTALVTGASGGIGRELARVHAEHHGDLVVVARSRDALRELKGELENAYGITVEVLAKDLNDPETPKEIFETLRDKNIEVEILINNAGFGTFAPFIRTDWDKQAAILAVNIHALTGLTHRFLPGMIERNRGRVLNVASTAAFYPGPLMSVYYASKHYVLAFSDSLAEEIRNSEVTITTLCPGPTDTGFQRRAGNENIRLMKKFAVMDPYSVAKYGYRKMLAGKLTAVPGLFNTLSAVLPRVLPRKAAMRIVRRQHEEE